MTTFLLSWPHHLILYLPVSSPCICFSCKHTREFLGLVVVGLFVPVRKYRKQPGKEQVYLSGHTSLLRDIIAGKGRDSETGTEAEAMGEGCLLACSFWLAQPAFI